MKRSLIALSCALAVLASQDLARASYLPAEVLFRLADPGVVESSGVAPASYRDDVLFTLNDSENPNIVYAIGPDGERAGTFTLEGARNIDWEDLGSGPGPNGAPALYIADFGDNYAPVPVRPFIMIHVIAEPVVEDLSNPIRATVPVLETQILSYEDGPHNAEALLVDPATGRIAIVTKDPTGVSGVYVAGDPLAGGVRILTRVGTIDLNAIADPAAPGGRLFITGGDISPDRTRLVVRTYHEAFEWGIEPSTGELDLGRIVAGPFTRIHTPEAQIAEAITYSRDGSALILTEEGRYTPVYRMRRA